MACSKARSIADLRGIRPVLCVVGPTASGKSDVAQCLAEALDGEVVSADSMQIYRGMDIGTGKVPPEERRVVHWGLDIVDPGAAFSASLYQGYARECFASIDARGKRSVLCGGTGFYVRAAIDDFEFPAGEQLENPVRERYTAYAEEHGPLALWELLREKDPESAAVVHPNNVRRVVRAFEMLEEGESYARQKEAFSSISEAIPSIQFGLSWSRDKLVERIEARVDRMFESGLIDEVRSLMDEGFEQAITAPQAIGYKEVVSALRGECSMDEAREEIKTATRRYAKRQRTWFKRDSRITWIDAEGRSAESIAEAIMESIDETTDGMRTKDAGSELAFVSEER